MNVTRTGIFLRSNAGRVLFRPFKIVGSGDRPLRLFARVLAISEMEVVEMLNQVLEEFGARHQRVRDYFIKQYNTVQDLVPTDRPLSEARQLLIGAYFTHEYSLEAAALFNPSIVPHPDQSGLPEGSLRYVLSLRATGEGHISSITFRTGTISSEGKIVVDTPNRFVTSPDHIPPVCYDKALFWRKVHELGIADNVAERIVRDLDAHFTVEELTEEIDYLRHHAQHRTIEFERTSARLLNLAKSNYEFFYTADQPLTERVIFPGSPNESNGIEDARFVRFIDDEGKPVYVATYTAYDGRVTIPQILETPDFLHFKISTLNGREVQGKGMALFPRKINGKFAMISRQDGEHLFLMYSDDLHFWNHRQALMKPTYPWEFVQIGNCGSPIETEAGWLVLSHGVGPMRKYSIGAFLLDREDPSHVIGRLPLPLLSPDETEREGYVPNVVYSCGALVHNGLLILPYAMSDSASSFATIPLQDVLAAMRPVDQAG
jgi:predicted GH43/DUF377 family glycosyl hydrolase